MIFLLACTPSDPALVQQGKAVDAWREGAALLDADPIAAGARFQVAMDAQADPLLGAWIAEAKARAGELPEAVDRLEEVLLAAPGLAEARYNRAAYLARLGRLDEAGPELERALEAGVRRPRQAMLDPDFASHLDDDAFAFLPEHLLMVSLDVPSDTLFWGNEAHLRLRVLGADAAPMVLDGEIHGPVELVRVREGVIDTSEGPAREVEWVYRVTGAGTVSIGPLLIRSAGHRHQLEPRTFETAAPPGKAPAGAPEAPLVLGADQPAETGSRFVDGVLWVRSRPGDRVELDPTPAEAPLQLEIFDRSDIVGILERYRVPVAPRIRIHRKGTVVYEG